MDFSAFNLLMNIVPNASSGETQDTAAASSAAKAQESIRTGEAFLSALKQARGGKTEKTAETIFSSMTAKADASSSLKNLRGQNAGDKNVKVIKLHIKRTRASETMQKADAARIRAKQTPDDRQKIPSQENTAALDEAAVVPAADSAVQAVPGEAQDLSFAADVPVFDESGRETALPAEETTAADILISAYLQPVQASQTQAPQPAPAPDNTEISVRPQAAESAPETVQTPEISSEETPAVLPRNHQDTAAETAPGIRPAVPAAEQITVPQEKTAAPKHLSVPEKTIIPDDTRSVRRDVLSANTAAAIEIPAEKAAPEAQAAAPAVKNNAPEKQAVRSALSDNTPDFSAEKSYGEEDHPETRRQAEDLAARLPADTKVSVTVRQDVHTAAASSFHASAKTKTNSAKEHKPVLTAREEQPVIETEQNSRQIKPVKAFEQAGSQNAAARPRADAHQQTLNTVNTVLTDAAAAAPKSTLAGQSSAPASFSSAVEGVSASGSANGSAVPAGQALFNAPNETLKGKAVSGSPVPAKTVPANELVDQIKINITKAVKAGLDKIDIILKPKELGTVRVRLEIDKDGNMKATLSASRADTLDILQKDISALKQALSDSGFNMNDNTFSFNYRGEQFDGNEHRAAQEQRREPEQAVPAAEEENDSEIADIAALSSGTAGRYALNIRV